MTSARCTPRPAAGIDSAPNRPLTRRAPADENAGSAAPSPQGRGRFIYGLRTRFGRRSRRPNAVLPPVMHEPDGGNYNEDGQDGVEAVEVGPQSVPALAKLHAGVS